MKVLLTGWWFTDAVRQVDCPRCGQKAGNKCRMPSGRKKDPPHGERCQAVSAKFGGGAEPWTNNGDGESGDERVKRVNKKFEALLRVED